MSAQKTESEKDELVLSLLDVAPSEVFNFERLKPDGSTLVVPIRVQLLRLEEDHQILQDAQAYAKGRQESAKDYGDLYREGQAVALLVRALRYVDKRDRADGSSYYPPRFTGDKQLRDTFTAAEMAQCLNMYEIVKAKYSPLRNFTEEDLDSWAEQLGDRLRGPFVLHLLESSHLPTLVLLLAQRVRQELERNGQLPSTLRDSSESDLSNSVDGTGSFSQLPSAHSLSNPMATLPTDHVMSKEEAAAAAERIYGKRPKE